MTISATDNIRRTYVGDGVTTVLSYPRQFQAATDLVVNLVDNVSGVATLQTLSTHYSVTGAGDINGGSVTFVTPPATGKTVVIYRDTDPVQNLDLDNVTSFPMTSMEAAYDRAMLVINELKTKLAYAILAPLTRLAAFDYTFPVPVASKVIGINAAGNGLELRSPQAWTSGTSDPTGGSGSVGDFYVNLISGDVFEKTGASTWTLRGNIRGPAGTAAGASRRYVATAVGGTAQAITLTTPGALAVLTQYDTFLFTPNANITGPGPTVAIDSVAALPLKSPSGGALAADEVHTGRWYEAIALGGATPTELRLIGGYE